MTKEKEIKIETGKFIQILGREYNFDNQMPVFVLRDLLKSYDCSIIDTELNNEIDILLNNFKEALSSHYPVSELEKVHIKIDAFTNDGSSLYSKSGNIFTACLLFGRYVPSILLKVHPETSRFKMEYKFHDNYEIKYDHGARDYVLHEPEKVPNIPLIKELKDYGVIVRCRQEYTEFHVLIEKMGMNAAKTFECYGKVLKAVGKEFPIVHKFVTDEDTFDLILKTKTK